MSRERASNTTAERRLTERILFCRSGGSPDREGPDVGDELGARTGVRGFWYRPIVAVKSPRPAPGSPDTSRTVALCGTVE
ncbi:hypothetical protein GCM10023083_67550 [Streptomyces phyllanthi]